MKKTTVTRIADLPPAFALARYEDASHFHIQEWLVNLEFRALRWNWGGDQSEQEAAAAYLLTTPLIPEVVSKAYWKGGLTKQVEGHQVKDQSVADVFGCHFDLGGNAAEDDPRGQTYAKVFERYISGEARDKSAVQSVRDPVWSALESMGIDDEGDTFVKVNLHASEEQLISDFANWLVETKRRRGIDVPKRRISLPDLQEWARFKVLPYLDLMLWARAHRRTISHQVMGLALFPDEFEVVLSDRVRKVVAPLAHKLVTEDFCAFLRSQAVGDMERKVGNWVPASWFADPETEKNQTAPAPGGNTD
jgi:hypothetical protein